jgi:hypothetical protein
MLKPLGTEIPGTFDNTVNETQSIGNFNNTTVDTNNPTNNTNAPVAAPNAQNNLNQQYVSFIKDTSQLVKELSGYAAKGDPETSSYINSSLPLLQKFINTSSQQRGLKTPVERREFLRRSLQELVQGLQGSLMGQQQLDAGLEGNTLDATSGTASKVVAPETATPGAATPGTVSPGASSAVDQIINQMTYPELNDLYKKLPTIIQNKNRRTRTNPSPTI